MDIEELMEQRRREEKDIQENYEPRLNTAGMILSVFTLILRILMIITAVRLIFNYAIWEGLSIATIGYFGLPLIKEDIVEFYARSLKNRWLNINNFRNKL